MIRVGKIQSRQVAGRVRIYCDYEFEGSTNQLWFEVEREYEDYLAIECGDAFFVALVFFAHLKGENISFQNPVSTRLYYGLVHILLPALRIIRPELSVIEIEANRKDFNFTPIAVGTALSLGVDSFHAMASSFHSDYPVTHLALFNSGAFGDFGGDDARRIFQRTSRLVLQAAIDMGLPLIAIDSNISEIIEDKFVRAHSIRNLLFALLLPKLFKVFYYASGYPVEKFKLDPSVTEPTHYDLLVSKALSTGSLEVMISGLHDDRIKKIAFLSRFEPSFRYLNVCVLADSNKYLNQSGGRIRNCSRCFKCVKTMAALDALGVLDSYAQVFDLELYKSKRGSYLGWILYDAIKLKSPHAIEILEESKKTSNFMSLSIYGYAVVRGLSNFFQKLRRRRKSRIQSGESISHKVRDWV